MPIWLAAHLANGPEPYYDEPHVYLAGSFNDYSAVDKTLDNNRKGA